MIHAEGLSKRFKVYPAPAARLKEIILRRPFHTVYPSLENVSFHVDDGETLGIIGPNGAGKSTLLKLLSGILIPDSGTVSISGKVTGLLELGTGFNPEMTGRQNIYMNGLLLGMTNDEIREKEQRIIDFTELHSFIDNPLKTYSSGMTMRLAFAVAYNAEPACFLVDEALSVGDAHFQQKCMKAIKGFKDRGGSIVFVSHDMQAVLTLCDQAILLDRGTVQRAGAPKDVVDHYHNMILQQNHMGESDFAEVPDEEHPSRRVVRTGDVKILNVRTMSESGEVRESFEAGETLRLVFSVTACKDLDDPHYGIIIRNRLGVVLFETNTYCMKKETFPLRKGESCEVRYDFPSIFSPGDYSITLGVANRGFDRGSFEEYISLEEACLFKVLDRNMYYAGLVKLSPDISLAKEDVK